MGRDLLFINTDLGGLGSDKAYLATQVMMIYFNSDHYY